MIKNMIDEAGIFTAFTGREESLADVQKLPELQGTTLVEMEQVHQSSFQLLDSSIFNQETNVKIPKVDALLTQEKNLALVVRVADCVPLLLYHQPSETIGVIHAGRKGTEAGITQKVLSALPSQEGPLHVWCGPHICEQCYQINQETNEHYNLLRKNLDQMYQVFEKTELNISFANKCTAHHNQEFYSYRKEGAGVPMNYGVIAFLN